MHLVIVILFSIFNCMIGTSQNFNGLWMRLDLDRQLMMTPRFNILDIENDNVQSFEFDTLYEEFEGPASEYFSLTGEGTSNGIKWHSNNHFTITEEAINIETSTTENFERAFIRLSPTVLHDGETLEILLNSEYRLKEYGMDQTIRFGKEYPIGETPRINRILGDTIQLESTQGIYFLSFYIKGKRVKIIPISEFSKNKMVIYGVSPDNRYVVANKIK
ncbi:MAG: hypothetical protein AAF575_00215 [Bacteroidota bacterium]